MELSFAKIKEIATGAVRIEEENGTIKLYRFTKEQEELYRVTNQEFYMKALSTAGIKLSFRTDSKNLSLKVTTTQGSSRRYFSVDIVVDGKPLDYLDNFSDVALPEDYTNLEVPLGRFEKSFSLGEGIKTVCVHLPWSASASIDRLSIEDGAFIEGIKPRKKLLTFGDSITQGYDALRPSNRYIAKLADKLDAEEFNKAIGGERFFPELAKLKDSFVPDYIMVAYGTNDWYHIDAETFKVKCKAFYSNLRENYPESKIFAITPIWRKDMNEKRAFGDFKNIEAYIRDAVNGFENIMVISGFDFVPKDETYFGDLRLHPNDKGFECYFESIYDKIKSAI